MKISRKGRELKSRRIERFIREHAAWIRALSKKYGIPSAAVCAVMHKEMQETDLFDTLADAAVQTRLLPKKDSSTGPMQIFGKVALRAVNFGVSRHLTTLRELGITAAYPLDENSDKDVYTVWEKLNRDVHFNMEAGVLNLLCCAEEMTGRIDFASYGAEEWMLVFTRYNQNTHHITPYGEDVYLLYLKYSREPI